MCDPRNYRILVVLDAEIPDSELADYERKIIAEVGDLIKHKITITNKDISITEKELFEWCWDNLERSCCVIFLVGKSGNIIGRFEEETDATAFKLRWA